ncbi:MAG: hypothetical protein IT423_21940 [Pirellulaceae bacterium]|nr:hypothetical protein [Pirellulaceae bacterium]
MTLHWRTYEVVGNSRGGVTCDGQRGDQQVSQQGLSAIHGFTLALY